MNIYIFTALLILIGLAIIYFAKINKANDDKASGEPGSIINDNFDDNEDSDSDGDAD